MKAPVPLRKAFISIAALALLFALTYGCALYLLKQQILKALGPDSTVQSISLSLTQVEITGLHLKATSPLHQQLHWPVAEELSAERIGVKPDIRSLFSDTIVIHAIEIDRAWLPILRTTKGMKILPGLRSQSKEDKDASESTPQEPNHRKIRIGQISFKDSVIDFYDATVGGKRHPISLQAIDASLEDLALPDLDTRSSLNFHAQVGAAQAGTMQLVGWLVPASLDSQLTLNLQRIPLHEIEPYLIKTSGDHIKRGVLSLDLNSGVQAKKLHAPGKLTLEHMELSGSNGIGSMGREAALALLRDRRDRIELSFTLQGKLDDPKFSLNEELYMRVGSALAESLGIGFENIGKGASAVTQGLGGFLKKLIK